MGFRRWVFLFLPLSFLFVAFSIVFRAASSSIDWYGHSCVWFGSALVFLLGIADPDFAFGRFVEGLRNGAFFWVLF